MEDLSPVTSIDTPNSAVQRVEFADDWRKQLGSMMGVWHFSIQQIEQFVIETIRKESKRTTIENQITEMGYAFRDLTYHSNGKFSCRLGGSFMPKGRIHEHWGMTMKEAVESAYLLYKEVERKGNEE